MEIAEYLEEFLPISDPFSVSHVKKDDILQEVHIYLTVTNKDLASDCVVHSYYSRTWEHLPLFEYRCFFHCEIPIYKNTKTKKNLNLRFLLHERKVDLPCCMKQMCFVC